MCPDPDRTASLLTSAHLAAARPGAVAGGAGMLDRMAFELGNAQLEHLQATAIALATGLPHPGWTTCAPTIAAALQALQALDHRLLQPKGGWWARATGKALEGLPQFQHQVQAAATACTELIECAASLEDLGAQARERALVELEVEAQGLDQAGQQGQRWLRDIRARLSVQAPAGDADAQRVWRQDQARAEALARRLPLLEAVVRASATLAQPCRALATRRAETQRQMAQDLAAAVSIWRDRQSVAVEAAQEGGQAASDGALSAHQSLIDKLGQLAKACAEAQAQEQACLQSLRRFAQQAAAAQFRYG